MRVAAMVGALALALAFAVPAQATKPMVSHGVVGCVIGSRFVPYAKHSLYTADKLPYWVRKSGGGKLEGQEIRLKWSGYFAHEVPNYVFERNRASWELLGPCQRDQLPAPAAKPAK